MIRQAQYMVLRFSLHLQCRKHLPRKLSMPFCVPSDRMEPLQDVELHRPSYKFGQRRFSRQVDRGIHVVIETEGR